MSPPDGSGIDPERRDRASERPDEEVPTQLFEALVHTLIEKGVLTRNDALSIVQTVTQVQLGKAVERNADAGRAPLQMLERMYRSFQALADGSGGRLTSADNVHQLRPPVHGDSPEFPRDE